MVLRIEQGCGTREYLDRASTRDVSLLSFEAGVLFVALQEIFEIGGTAPRVSPDPLFSWTAFLTCGSDFYRITLGSDERHVKLENIWLTDHKRVCVRSPVPGLGLGLFADLRALAGLQTRTGGCNLQGSRLSFPIGHPA